MNYEALQDALKKSFGTPEVIKATFNNPTIPTQGLQGYNLEGPAKLLIPVITPLRNETPRVKVVGGMQANWKAITGLIGPRASGGVPAGKRGALVNVSQRDYSAVFKTIGSEGSYEFEAELAAEGFDDVRVQSSRSALQSTMINEEAIMLGGNTSMDLGITPTPVLVGAVTGGFLPAATYSVICVALTAQGRINASIADGVLGRYNRTSASGAVAVVDGGAAQQSVAASVATTGTTSRITASVTAVRGAFAYAWYVGPAGAERLNCITGYAGAIITLPTPGIRQLATVLGAIDASTDDYVFDGLLTQAVKTGNGGYWQDLGGATLTPDGAGGIVEIDAVLRRYADRLRMSPDTMWISTQEAVALTAAMLGAGVANGAFRIVINPEQGGMMGGILVATYLNKYSMQGDNVVKIRIHPNMPQGTILFTASTIPYPLSGVSTVCRMLTRKDYHQIDWSPTERENQIGVYADVVMQHYFPPSLAVLTGVGKYQEDTVLA